MTCLYQKSDMAHQVLPLLRLLLLLPWTACSLRKLKLSKIKYLQLNGQWTWKVNWQLRNWIQEGRKPWNLLELSWALDLKSSRAENLISGLRTKIKKKKKRGKNEKIRSPMGLSVKIMQLFHIYYWVYRFGDFFFLFVFSFIFLLSTLVFQWTLVYSLYDTCFEQDTSCNLRDII